jgi:DNA repair photolyase
LDNSNKIIKGRGAQINPSNPYHHLDYGEKIGEEPVRTQYIKVYPKSILNKVDSPDIGMAWSMNPYQGCEHGCVYCYARNTHNYWGYSAGLDFEQKILVKEDAPKLLEEKLKQKNWAPMPIMLSGNTDCYQPAELKFGITRAILQVLKKYKHPVGIITKNSLILRDLDIIKPMAAENLLRVSVSLTTLDEDTRRFLEPRTTTIKQRLATIRQLVDAGVSVNVMLAPIIPGLTDHEILPMAEQVSSLGASSIAYTLVRLNGDVGAIFEDWARRVIPDRADRILNRIKDCRGGTLEEKRFGIRMRGEGKIAEMVAMQFKLAKERFFKDKPKFQYNLDAYKQLKNPQLKLF